MSDEYGQTLAAFVLDTGKQSRRLLKRLQEIDDVDANVKIVDAAIADRTRFRVKVHQTTDLGGAKGTVRGAGLGVIVGAIVLGPAGAVVGGAAGGVLNGLRNRMHDIGIDDKFMRQVTKELDKGKSALFILYEGNWGASIGMIEQALTVDKALLISSTLPAREGSRAEGARRPGGRAARRRRGRIGLRGRSPRGGAGRGCRAGRGRGGGRGCRAGRGPRRPDPACRRRPEGQRRAGDRRDHDLRGPGRGQRAAGPACAARGGHGAARQCRDLADAGQLRREGRLAGPHEVQQAEAPSPATSAATKPKAAEGRRPPDDLTQLNGIGPRISSILSDGGVTTYAELEHTDPSDLRKIIAQGGALPPSSLDTWPTQASYAERGDWQGLASYNSHK